MTRGRRALLFISGSRKLRSELHDACGERRRVCLDGPRYPPANKSGNDGGEPPGNIHSGTEKHRDSTQATFKAMVVLGLLNVEHGSPSRLLPIEPWRASL